MDKTRRALERKKRHARELAQNVIAEAGTPSVVGRALGVARSTAAHWKSDRVHPALRDAFLVLLSLTQYPGLDAEGFVQACEDALEFGALVMVEDEDLIREGLRLYEIKDTALRKVVKVSAKLSRTIRELRLRGIDLHTEYHRRLA